MRKYKVFLDFYLPDGRKYNIWEIITFTNDSLQVALESEWYIWEIHHYWWKIWDYVVYDYNWEITYNTINNIAYLKDKLFYNWFEKEKYREPTLEELNRFYNLRNT